MRINPTITSDGFDRCLSRVVCFGGAQLILICAVAGLQRVGATPSELLLGVLAAATLSVSLVVLGIVTGPKSKAG